jgi:hypothetical protein
LEPRERLEREGEVGKGKTRGNAEEEPVDSTTSSPVTMTNKEAFFRIRRENRENQGIQVKHLVVYLHPCMYVKHDDRPHVFFKMID